MFQKLFKDVWEKANKIDEKWYDFILWGVILILIGVLLFGEKKHKILTTGYFLLP